VSLPALYIETMGTLDFEKKKDIRIRQISIKDTVLVSGTAKWRGGWSRQFDKKSFSIDTEYPISLAGMKPHTKWILNASYIDKTMMRHRFWYELWQSINPNHEAAACRYVLLNVDGQNQGLYIAMERIHESRLGITPSGVLFKDPQVFRKDTIPAEKDDSYFHQKYPDPEIENRDSLLFKFQDFLHNSDSTSFCNQIDQWVDIGNMIDWHLLLLLSDNGDGLLKNFYLYMLSDKDLLKVIPWDYDHSAGRDGDNELNLRNTFIDDDRNILLDRLMKLNAHDYNNKRRARWQKLRQANIISIGPINDRIEFLKNEIASSIEDNFKIWPYDGPGYYDANNHEEEVQIMQVYLKNRIDFLDRYFATLN